MKQERRFIVDILFVLALFGLFTVSALILVTVGAETYQNTVENMDRNYETRTSVAYLTEKLRQNDSMDSISLSALSGEPALMMTQEINGKNYSTWLYFYDGYLKELLMLQDGNLGTDTLDAGQNIMKLSGLTLTEMSDHLFSMELVTANGEAHQIYVSSHCTKE